jgi:hypothetical protein
VVLKGYRMSMKNKGFKDKGRVSKKNFRRISEEMILPDGN